MSGIYGTTIHYDEKIVEKKLEFIRFRGRDYSQIKKIKINEGRYLTFGFNGSLTSHNDTLNNQPFDYKSKYYAIFDGNISNRNEIQRKYLSIETNSSIPDVKIICQLYETIGVKCVNEINGNFAFAIFDYCNNKIFGARDRLGIKPLYFCHSNMGFEFCSQLRPISYSNNFHINITARKFYWIHQYIPDPISIYDEVQKIKAGHFFNYDISSNNLIIDKYWDIHYGTGSFRKPKTYDEACETVDSMLRDSINKSINNTDKAAIYLSGGIDSSLLASYLSKSNINIEAFSVGFDISSYDETYYARAVSKQLNIKYNQLNCNSSNALSIIENLNQYYDEPMADLSAIATAFLSKEVSSNYSVSFGGDGGDEIFWGYDHYLLLYNIMRTPTLLKSLGSKVLRFTKYNPYVDILKYENAEDIISSILLIPFMNTYKGLVNYKASDYLFYGNDLDYVKNSPNKYQIFADLDLMSRCVYAFNTKVERANSYFGIDFNAPYMDYKVVEYSKSLPLKYLYNKNMGQKRLLRELLYKNVDRKLFERQKKGFGVPFGHWIRTDLKDLLYSNVNNNILKEFEELNSEAVLSLRDKHMSNEIYAADFLWRIINYANWSKSVND